MPPHKKVVARKRQSLQILRKKRTPPLTSKCQQTPCSLCNNGLLETHPIGSSQTIAIQGCTWCQLRFIRATDNELLTDSSIIHCVYCYEQFCKTDDFYNHVKKHHSDFLKTTVPTLRPLRKNSNASDTTTILSDTETASKESSLRRDDTVILEVSSDKETKSDGHSVSTSSSLEGISNLSMLCRTILGSQKASMGNLASDDTIDRVLPGFSMSIINMLQDDQWMVINDPGQGASFQIRRIPSLSSPDVDPIIVLETPSNSETEGSAQMTSTEPKQQPPEKRNVGRETRKRKATIKDDQNRKKRGRHVEREIHKCPDCDKTFNRRYNLKIHRYVHSEQKKLECKQCQQQFKHVGLLRNHKRIKHGGEKPYTCGHCGQGFIQNNYLQRHMLLHSSQACTCCNQKFDTRREFNLHVRKVHVQSDSTKCCKKCNLTFASLLELSRHLLSIKNTEENE